LSYKKALIRLLDRPGGRFLLGEIVTRFLRQINGVGIKIEYIEGMWTHRIGCNFFPDSYRFDYTHGDFGEWKGQVERYASDAEDYWLQFYRPQEGDVIVDVGAGHGEDTLTFSRAVGQTGRVIAIEAHPLSFAILKNLCLLNQLTNVTPLKLALMDKEGTVLMAETESPWMDRAIQTNEEAFGIAVPASTLTEVCAQQGLEDIAFLKMNIEGAERHALVGLEPVIQRIRQICVACHDFRSDRGEGDWFRTRAFVEQFLVQHGFTLASRPEDPRDFVRNHIFGLRSSGDDF
jgi:FkbM family methyltransferase